MTHPNELLPGYVLGDLEPHQAEQVEAHLLACSTCQAEVGQLRDALFLMVVELPAVAVPVGGWERLQARRHAMAEARSAPVPATLLGIWRLWPLAAAVVVGLLLGGVGTWTQIERQNSNQRALMKRLIDQGARTLPLTNAQGQAFGTVLLLESGEAFIALNQAPPAGQVYQVWGRRDVSTKMPISLGMTDSTLLKVIRCNSYQFVGVSLEPIGGNAAPTHPLGRVQLPRS